MLDPTLEKPNATVIDVWNTILFDKFTRFREVIVGGFRVHGDAARRAAHLASGERVLDVGCGFGDTTLQLAEAVGPTGEAVGLDCAPAFIAEARAAAAAAGAENARFVVADAQTDPIEGGFDVLYSRFGTMFFDNPVAALRNLAGALRPGGRLSMVVWRARGDNELFERPVSIVEAIVTRPTDSDLPTCGPGPFSLASPSTVEAILARAGFVEVALERHDADILAGRDLEEAVDCCLTIGPAGETMRLAGEAAEQQRPRIEAALREALRPFATPSGVRAPTSTWVVTARRG